MHPIWAGFISGFTATIPMTLVMVGMHRLLPKEEQDPLPPRKITMKVAEATGIKEKLDEPKRFWMTAIAHFGYGTVAGALYGFLIQFVKLHALIGGIGFGLLIWAGSYLGWLPAARILPPATKHPARRNILMITAHIVYGAITGLGVEYLIK